MNSVLNAWLDQLLDLINEMMEENNRSPFPGLNLEDRLQEDLHLDSFDLAELTVRIENRFGVDVFEDGVVYTVRDVIAKLEQGRTRNG